MRPKRGELCVVEALHAERYAVDAGGAVPGEAAALDGARVGLHGDLDVRRERQHARQAFEQTAERIRREEARGATAHEDADDGPRRDAAL